MVRNTIVIIAAAALAACNQAPKSSGNPLADTGIFLARSARAKDSLIRVKDSLIAEKSRQLSVQSQLIGDAATSARLVSEIDRDLSKVRGLRVARDTARTETGEPNASEQLARVQKKVNTLIARLSASEQRVRKMRSDSATHAGFDSTQAQQLRDYERSLAELRSSVDRQQQEIAVLTARVDSMTKVNSDLTAKNVEITARNAAMAAHEDSVFVAIGTEKELAARGLVRREGGTRLLFGKGKTIVPARHLDPAAFQVISKEHDLTIPLPKADKYYRVVSRQSLEYSETTNVKSALVRGSLKITNPDSFWAPSRFLILVQK